MITLSERKELRARLLAATRAEGAGSTPCTGSTSWRPASSERAPCGPRCAPEHDLAPLLDGLRLIKSDAEIALLRCSGRLAPDALVAAMRRTGPGIFEYQLDAGLRYVYLDGGARRGVPRHRGR